MSLRSPLARVRGLGAAGEGVGHWWAQRVTALALVPLTIWFVIAVAGHAGASYDEMRAWLGSPFSAGMMILLIAATFYHAALGLQVVLEDYVHHEGIKIASILVVKGLAIILGLTAALSVLSILFRG